MKISRNKGYVSDQMLNALLQEFEAGTEVSGNSIVFKDHTFEELYEILPDAFIIKPSVSRSEAIGLFSQALRTCRRVGAMSPDALMKEAADIHHRSLAVPESPFTLWTKFRARNMAHAEGFELEWKGVKLGSVAGLPEWLQLDEYFVSGIGRIYPDQPHFFGHVVLTCRDRDESRAVDRMMDALQLMMGLLNMYDMGRSHIWRSGRNWAEGQLWLGPNQFVFRDKDFRGNDRIWYNPDYDEAAWTSMPLDMKRVLNVVPLARDALTALENHPLNDVLIRAMMLLQDGFASRDSSHRLLRYWAALEQLYVEADAKNGSNEKVIQRSLFGETQPELSRWKLAHIARLRNDYVHAGGGDDDLQPLCQFLRELVVRHINHWIFVGHDLPNHGGLIQFVKLPSDKAKLQELRTLVDRRLDYLEQMETPDDEEPASTASTIEN